MRSPYTLNQNYHFYSYKAAVYNELLAASQLGAELRDADPRRCIAETPRGLSRTVIRPRGLFMVATVLRGRFTLETDVSLDGQQAKNVTPEQTVGAARAAV